MWTRRRSSPFWIVPTAIMCSLPGSSPRPPKLITSALVIAEGHGWFLRKYDAGRAVQFLNFIGALTILEVRSFNTAALEKAAKVIRKFPDQKLTLADAHGLVLVNEGRIASCWSTDRHMTLTGVPLVTNT